MSMWYVSRDCKGLVCEPAIESLSQDLEWIGVNTFQNEARCHSYLRLVIEIQAGLRQHSTFYQEKKESPGRFARWLEC